MKRPILCLIATWLVVPAFAEDLPGVTKPKQIVQPVPEPVDQKSGEDTQALRVGDWDVNISGSVIVDVGVGGSRQPPR
ncbi:MAG: hypothetical protein KF810_20540 [Rhizobiaceae bacterium]|nr:hypothetical protein [Rhizobiaceae bacterium]